MDKKAIGDSLSISAVDMYLRCGEQFRRRYILGQKQPPGIALVDGSSYHAATEYANRVKLEKGRQAQTPRVVNRYIDTLRSLVKKEKKFDWGGETENSVYKKAKILLPQYMNKIDPKIDPDWVEQPFKKDMTVEGQTFEIVGVVDVTTKRKAKHFRATVADYKTSSQPKSQQEVDDSVQLTLYNWATGLNNVAFINFVKTANPYMQVLTGRRAPCDVAWASMVCQRVHQSIRVSAFPLTSPSKFTWWCSEKFCGYWKDCRGKFVAARKVRLSDVK